MKDVINFMEKFKKEYSEYFVNDRLQKCKYGYTCDVNQIYCYLNKKNIEDTEYYTFFKISKLFFNFKNKKILEVCCGKIPILSSLYKRENLNISATNNKILINNYKNIPTFECDFENDTDIKEYDIIIGLRPCSPTEKILDLCLKHKKDFIIYLCPCIHEPLDNNFKKNITYEEWINYLKEKLYKYNDYQLYFLSYNKLPDNCPIIIGKYIN